MANLKKWIKDQLDAGYSQDQILQSLLKAGYPEARARSALQKVLNQRKPNLKTMFKQYKPLIYLLVLLVIILFFTGGYLYASHSPTEEKTIKSLSLQPFTEEQCLDLLSKHDPSVKKMTFKENYINAGMFNTTLEPVLWKVNITGVKNKDNNKPVYRDKEPMEGKHVFFVTSDKFEGCGITEFYPLKIENFYKENDLTCRKDDNLFMNIKNEENYDIIYIAITPSPGGPPSKSILYVNKEIGTLWKKKILRGIEICKGGKSE